MAIKEIIGAIIDSDFVTNDPATIDAARSGLSSVQYVSRDRARSLAKWTKQTEGGVLAEGPVAAPRHGGGAVQAGVGLVLVLRPGRGGRRGQAGHARVQGHGQHGAAALPVTCRGA